MYADVIYVSDICSEDGEDVIIFSTSIVFYIWQVLIELSGSGMLDNYGFSIIIMDQHCCHQSSIIIALIKISHFRYDFGKIIACKQGASYHQFSV